MIKREHYLEQHLEGILAEREHTPFKWGENDCALFAADAIEAMTGCDIAADFRNQYENEVGAALAIKRITGGSSLADAAAYCANKHGMVEYEFPLMAKRGDLVLVRNRDGSTIAGIVSLNGRHIVSPGDEGLVRFCITQVLRAWSLGDEHVWRAPSWHAHSKVEDASLPELPASTD
jgi:hypothetical protein